MRLFIALPLTPEVHGELDKFTSMLRSAVGDSLRWVDSSNIHLTLKFLGEVEVAKLPALTSTLEKIINERPSFAFDVIGTGVFPAWNHPRIVWAGVAAPTDLNALQVQIDAATRELGFPSEGRPYSPHLTLGRVNGWMSPSQLSTLRARMDEAKDRLFGSVKARQLTVFKSTLKPTGAVYTPEAVIDFASVG